MNKKLLKQVNWQKMNNLVPAIIQDASGLRVLMLGYMNQESLKKTLEDGKVWFYSRSKQRLWQKGEKSGNFLRVRNIYLDCDQDTLLITVKPEGSVCHTGKQDCFGIGDKWFGLEAFVALFALIEQRKKLMPKGSYTTSLFAEGLNKICAKIDEEAGEVIGAASKETKQRLISESVDLIYHLFVACVEKNVDLKEIIAEINRRRK